MRLFLSTVTLFFFSTAGFAKNCELSIDSNDQMQYSSKELTIEKDCTDVKITLKHTGKLPKSAMGHNLVITTDKDMQPVIADGIKAGLVKEYVPEGDARVIAATKLVGGGESTTVTFKASALKSSENYKFFCTFPGHSGIMNGTIVVKK